MKIKNTVASFIIVLFVYVAALVGSIFMYKYFPFDYWLSLLITDIAATVFVFIFSLIFENASVYDSYWSVQPIVILPAFACAYGINLLGILLLVAVGYWGLCLTINWKHGRHPNYFGEILMWWGIGLACVVAIPSKWYLLAGALVNTIMFLCASVPMAEKRQNRKEGFAEYKKQTRILI